MYTFGPIPNIDYHQYEWLTKTDWPYVVRQDSDRVEALNWELQPKVNEFFQRAAMLGINLKLVSTTRTSETQEKLYEQGRTMPGLIVTYVPPYVSYHNYGLAFDVAIIDRWGAADYSEFPDQNGNAKNDWLELADVAMRLNILWGGYFPEIRDTPHFEYHPNQNEVETLWRLSHGYNPLKAE